MTIGSNTHNPTKAFYSPDELAEYLAISKATVYRLVNKRQLPSHKVGGVLRFRAADIEKYLDNVRVGPIQRQIYECKKKIQ